ncbi:MAG: hypothetical protein P8177_04685, partial [Gemmatimonadota bacterium]
EARLGRRVERVVEASVALAGRDPSVVLRWAMGEIMRGFRGRVDPADVRRRVTAALRTHAAGATA